VNLFKSSTWHQWKFEKASESFTCPSPDPYDLHTQYPCVDQLRESYHHHLHHVNVVCSNCQSFNHYMNSCPYDVITDEGLDGLNKMIEIMNEQNARFEDFLWEYHLVNETSLSLPFLSPKVSLYDDDESFYLLEFDFIVDTS